jgi:hypothetical protein
MYKEFTLLQLRFEPNQIKSEVAGHFSLLSKVFDRRIGKVEEDIGT